MDYPRLNTQRDFFDGLLNSDEGILPPGRNLTNVLVVYDREYPAPAQLKESWERFQKGSRPSPDPSVFFY
ncbi:hypothetical protein [Microcoleus asticus]|uniref:Uncharacterized protein n=1 Tax=Microcoleus asticus IPMA8 TaxID=2563858 RepID=A0ABX2CUU3_9CYAN|nr:hypothetical protein [Microcoleus asticus]NQE34177.1 hypothetical protein [Microcoleus asticus IPMA8]